MSGERHLPQGGDSPTVGDAVRISVLDEEKKKGSLDEILPRRNELIRPRVSNVDQAVIVFAAKSPNMNLDLLDRFLLLAEEQELDIVIVINKIDKDKKENYLAAAGNVSGCRLCRYLHKCGKGNRH